MTSEPALLEELDNVRSALRAAIARDAAREVAVLLGEQVRLLEEMDEYIPEEASEAAREQRLEVTRRVSRLIVAGLIPDALRCARGIADAPTRARALIWIAEAYERASDIPTAQRYLREALEVTRDSAEEWRSSWLREDLVSSLALVEEWELAREVASEIPRTDSRAGALRDLAMAELRGRDLAAVRETFAEVERCLPDLESDKEYALNLAWIAAMHAKLEGAAAARDTLEEAVAVARELDREQYEEFLGVGVCIATAQAYLGDDESALQTALAIENSWSQATALGSVATVMAKLRKLDAAVEIALRFDEPEWRDGALQHLAGPVAQLGEIALARATADRIASPWRRVEALTEIAAAQTAAHEIPAAHDLLADAFHLARDIKARRFQTYALNKVALAQAGACDFPGAVRSAAAIRQNPSPTFAAVASAQARAGDFVAAAETAWMIRDEARRSETLATITQSQAATGAFAAAVETAQRIDRPWSRVEALAGIAVAQARAGEHRAARASLASALVVAHAIRDDARRAQALLAVAAAQHQVGGVEAALETLAATREATERIEDEALKATLRAEFAIAQVRSGDRKAAVQTAEHVLEVADHHFGRIATVFLESGDQGDLKRLLFVAAHRPYAAEQLRRLLPRIYPEQAAQIAAALLQRAGDES